MNGAVKKRNDLEQETAFGLYRISRLLRHDLILFLKKSGTKITPEQYFLLFRMAQMGPCPQKDLADPVLQDHPNVTRQARSYPRQESGSEPWREKRSELNRARGK